MDGGQQFQSEWRFEALYQIDNPVQSFLRFRVIPEEIRCPLYRAGYYIELLARGVAAVPIAGHQVAFDGVEDVAHIFGKRAIGRFGVVQAQRFARFGQKVHQLVRFQQSYERLHQPAEVTAHQHNEGGPARRHCRNFG